MHKNNLRRVILCVSMVVSILPNNAFAFNSKIDLMKKLKDHQPLLMGAGALTAVVGIGYFMYRCGKKAESCKIEEIQQLERQASSQQK